METRTVFETLQAEWDTLRSDEKFWERKLCENAGKAEEGWITTKLNAVRKSVENAEKRVRNYQNEEAKMEESTLVEKVVEPQYPVRTQSDLERFEERISQFLYQKYMGCEDTLKAVATSCGTDEYRVRRWFSPVADKDDQPTAAEFFRLIQYFGASASDFEALLPTNVR